MDSIPSILLCSAAVLARGDLATERNALLGSLDTCKDAHLGVADKVHDDHGPTWVRRNHVIELGCEGAQGRETGPRNGWEIMMLVVVSHLIGKELVQETMHQETSARCRQER